MKTWERFAVGAGIVLVLYMVMKDGSKDDDYEYGRRKKGASTGFQEWERKRGSRS